MKQKLLPFAVLLAAISVMLISSGVIPAPWNSESPDANSGTRASNPADFGMVADSPSIDAGAGNQLVRQAAQNFQQLPPLVSRIRFKAEMFDSEISGPGQMMLQGQGSRKSRLEFVFAQNGRKHRLIQVCDDDFYYYIRQSDDGERRVELVDLNRLSSAGERNSDLMITGGIDSLLSRLQATFAFTPPVEDTLGELPVWRLQGHWRIQALQRLLKESVEPGFFDRDDWPDHLPPQIPHQVELVLARDGRLPLFPYRIAFQRRPSMDDSVPANSTVSLELFEVQIVQDIPSEMFDIRSGDDRPRDRTAFYLERLNRLR